MRSTLPLADLASRHPGLSAGVAQAYEEAARVSLARHHVAPVLFRIRDNDDEHEADVNWADVDAALSNAWANHIDTTEAGAYAMALATFELVRGLVAVRRAETLTGADYYVDRPGAISDDLESAVRLEVSGMSGGTLAALEARLRRKLEQARAGESNLPAAAIVVGFERRAILSTDLRST